MLPGVSPITPGVEFQLEVALGNIGDDSEFLYDDPSSLWDTALYSGDELSWTVITVRGLEFTTSRGRDKWGSQFRAGSGSMLLSSDDGLFNPNFGAVNLGTVTLRPGRFVRISARWQGDQVWVPLFVGRINTLQDVYIDAAHAINSAWQLEGFGSFLNLANPPALTVPIAAGQVTSDRVIRVLTDAGFSGVSPQFDLIEVGVNTMGSSTLSGSGWAELQKAASAEWGGFWFAGDGRPVFKNQTIYDLTAPLWGAGGINDDVEIVEASTMFSVDNVRNDIQMSRVGGTAQRVVNTVSQAQYLTRSHRQFDLECETDAQVFTIAELYRDYFAFDQLTVRRCELIPLNEQGARNLMALELLDTIRLQVNTGQGWSYAQDVTVQKIEHRGSASDWVVQLTVEAADRSNPADGGAYDAAYAPAEYDVDTS